MEWLTSKRYTLFERFGLPHNGHAKSPGLLGRDTLSGVRFLLECLMLLLCRDGTMLNLPDAHIHEQRGQIREAGMLAQIVQWSQCEIGSRRQIVCKMDRVAYIQSQGMIPLRFWQ